MILTADGQILTNNHVVAGATSIVVTVVATGEKYDARVVGTDATNDVALLQLDGASGLDTVAIDDDGGAAVGDAVTGVGNAGGTGGTPSAADGSVTALDQDITVQDETTGAGKQLTGLIQTDADIQSGDSGGPLYDSEGEVVGVDTAASSGGTDIDGFAIPIDDALSIVDQIRTGVATDTVSIGYPAFIGIGLAASGAPQTVPGAVVGSVIENTPAASIGLAAGDVITGLNGVAIDSAETLTATMATLEPGQTVSVTWTTASGTSQTADVTLIEGPVG
nr:trypsin-like peptidase domain-containing protein [Plantibacter sp. CFBP 8798]